MSITGTNAEPDLYRDVSLSTYELLTGSVQFKEANGTAKAVFAPFKLGEKYRPVLSEIGLNIVQDKSTTTLGVGAAYNSKTAFSTKAIAALATKVPKPFRDQEQGESEEAYDLAYKAYLDEAWATAYDEFYSDLAKCAWIVSAAYNVQTFGVIGGDLVDLDEDGAFDNFYRKKGYDVSATVTYTANQATGFTASVHHGRRRATSKENSALATYPGWSATFGRRIKILNPAYKTSADYLSSLFVPSIVVGASFEAMRCNGDAASCDEGLRRRRSITPFIEFKISPEAQFRIGVPIRRSVSFGGKSKTELAPGVQYVLQLKGLK